LPGKTISVGNLTVGGTGKTPVVIWLAQQLQALPKVAQAAGYRPGILARGYGRRDENELIVLRPGEGVDLPVTTVGDEALLMRRHLPDVPIGLCADRLRAAQALAADCAVNLFLLDDAYQGLDVARDVNLLLVDANETASARGRNGLVPIGRLREPESAASRADIILLTRCQETPTEDTPPPTLQERLRRFTAAPIFHARTVPLGFFAAAQAEPALPEGEVRRGRWLAFCGIGNPGVLFADLRRWGMTVAREITFRDHHCYSAEDLSQLEKEAEQAGAAGLITTEKDFLNLRAARRGECSGHAGLPRTGRGLLLCYVRVRVEPIEPEFWQEILRRLEEAPPLAPPTAGLAGQVG
jgi:tetraacyldisaccharide 4'-kinase